MSLGIDPGTVLRFANGRNSESCFGAQGAPPCRLRENDYVWSRRRIARQTSRDGIIAFEQAWSGLHGSIQEDVPAGDGVLDQSHFSDLVVAEAFRQLAPSHVGKVALAVDNSLSEDLQDTILGICSRAHFTNIDLLWRPVAILLDYLDRNPSCRLTAKSRVLVVDAESNQPEATLLGLRDINGTLVPVRRFFQKDENTLALAWSAGAAGPALAKELVMGKGIPADELFRGAFSADFFRYRDGEEVNSTWVKRGAGYEPFVFEKKLDELLIKNRSLDQLINPILSIPAANEADLVLWHGWPFRADKSATNDRNVIMLADSVSHGCRVYADRVDNGLPTYLEVMPGLAIMSRNPVTNRDEFFPIINSGEYLGGQTINVQPINRFSLDRCITELKIILQRDDWVDPKQVEFDGIPPLEQPAPITVSGEMKPGQGKLKLWLTSRNNQHDDLFGERARIEINWDTMEDYLQPQQSPEVYPARGYVNIGNLDHIKSELTRFVRNSKATLTTPLEIPERPRQFKSILEPNNGNHPGLFGTQTIDDPEMNELAIAVGKKVSELLHHNNNDRVRYLNYMYSYAPSEFIQELRDIYTADGLPSDVKWNGAYAPGRVFSSPEDISLFMNYLVKVSDEHSWPRIPNVTYADKYFWSVFRCLCYHETTADIDKDLADQVCLRICNYIETRNNRNWAPLVDWEKRDSIENAKKFCLCAILFLTRVRRYKHPGFLKANLPLTKRVLMAIENMPHVRFVALQMDNVNQLVLRYIRNEADSDDESAVSGLVAEMS
jgi:hypothetical protein